MVLNVNHCMCVSIKSSVEQVSMWGALLIGQLAGGGVVDCVCLCAFPAGLQAVKETWCCPDEPGSVVGEAS